MCGGNWHPQAQQQSLGEGTGLNAQTLMVPAYRGGPRASTRSKLDLLEAWLNQKP